MCDLYFEDPYFSIEFVSKFNEEFNNLIFIFTGVVEKNIKDIFEKIEKKKSTSKAELTLLDKTFPNDFKKWYKWIVKENKNIRFIDSRIMLDDSLNELKRKIFVYCSNPENDLYILPTNMEIWLNDNNKKPYILGYKYKDMKPHIYENVTLEDEYKYELYNEELHNVVQSKEKGKKILESSDNYTLLYDLYKMISLKENDYHFYVSDALYEFNAMIKSKEYSKYGKEEIQNKYLKKYFPVAIFDLTIQKMKSAHIQTKDDSKYNDFIIDNLFQFKMNDDIFEPCHFNNFVLNINNYGVSGESNSVNLLEGGASNLSKSQSSQLLKSSKSSKSSKSESLKKELMKSKSKIMNMKKEKIVELFEFIDLYQIFEYLRTKKIGKKIPFIKYYDYGFSNPFTLISKKAVDENIITKEILLKKWMNPNIPYKKINSLQVKRYIKNFKDDNTPLFTTINLYKYGRVQLSVAFKTENKASFQDIQECIENTKSFIEDINKNVIDYRISRSISIDKKIMPPETRYEKNKGIVMSENCNIAYMNYFIEYTSDENIDLKDMFQFCKLFPSFLTVHPTKSFGVNSIEIRYNRVSGYANLDEIMEKIQDLKMKNVNERLIIQILQKEFGKSQDECSKFLLEYKKKYSHIQSKSDSSSKLGFVILITKNNVTIKGVRNMRHIYDTYRFVRLFISLFLQRFGLRSNPTYKQMLFSRDMKEIEDTKEMYEGLFDVKQEITFEDLNLDFGNDEELLNMNVVNAPKNTVNVIENIPTQEVENEENINPKNDTFRLIVGDRLLAANNEIGTDVQLTCEDAIPELDTCEDFCNDAKYFIRRLQRHDARLFYDKREKIKGQLKYSKYMKYSKSCQKFRQPVVLSYDPESGLSIDTKKEIKRSSYTYSIKYGSDMNKPNWYICPNVWCPYCVIPIDIKDVDPSTIRQRKTAESGGVCVVGICPNGDHQVFIRDEKLVFPGFQEEETSEEGLCLPCCFVKPQNNPKYKGAFKSYQKCLGLDVENEDIEENKIYVLKTMPLDKNRFGVLNSRLEKVLNSNIPKGYLEYRKGYLRRGIKHENLNSFLSAIANIFSCDQDNVRSVDDMKTYIVSKIDETLFRSLYGGNLVNVFYDPHKNISSLENYKKYILSKNIEIDHTYLWDLIQRPSIISKTGVNLFIFENDLLCPLGENVLEFYDKSRKTIILAKYHQYYEPIYYLEGNGKQAMIQCIFENNTPEIEKLFEIAYDGCKSYHRIDWKSVVYDSVTLSNNNKNKKLLNKDEIIIDYGVSLKETIKTILLGIEEKKLDVSYLPKTQYVDKMNKVFGILLQNKLFVPVAPSKLMVDIPDIDYLIIDDYAHISKISFEKTYEYLNNLSKVLKLPVKPIGIITDIKNENVVGMVTEKNRVILVEKISVIKTKKSGLKNMSNKYYTDIDMYISNNVNLIDERILFMNKRKYEDETYIRLKFELSRYLQDHNKERDTIIQIIKSDDKDINHKRSELEKIILPIINKLISIEKTGYNYNFYEIPNQRMPCGVRSVTKSLKNKSSSKSGSEIIFSCDEDPHCVSVENKCKLHVNEYNLIDENKKNLNMYIPMIIEEFIRFTLKRKEILDDNIPSIINKEHIIENISKYYMLNTTDPIQMIQKINTIFLDKEGLYIDQRPVFDIVTTSDYVLPKDKYTIINTSKLLSNMNEMPEQWSKILGYNFVLIKHYSGSKNLFVIMDMLINEMKRMNNSNTMFKNINSLDIKMIKNMMFEFMENPKYKLLFRNIQKKMKIDVMNKMNNESKSKSDSRSNFSKTLDQREYIVSLYKGIDSKIFRNVNDFQMLKNKILNDDYEGNDLDIVILAHIMKMNIIILNKSKKDNTQAVMYGNENNDYFTNYVMMLRNNNIDNNKYQWFQVKNKGLIFKEKDLSEKFIHSVLDKLN